jgi:RNA polymerase sigma factor (sigma-70 family)
VVLRSQTDERLVVLARDGHDQAFVTIVNRYRRELLAHARRIAPADRSEDIVQQAMLSAWSALRRQAEVLDVRAWLHRIVHNAALRVAARTERHDELSETLAAEGSTDVAVEERLEAREALVAVAALPDRQRRALELTALGGASGTVAAAELGVSEGTLRQLVHRARTTLRSGTAALTPAPLLSWAAGGSGDSVAARVAELGAGAGLAATVTKIGATVAVTVTIVGGATQVLPGGHDHHPRSRHQSPATNRLGRERQAQRDRNTAAGPGEPSAPGASTGAVGQSGGQDGQSAGNVQANGGNQNRDGNEVGQAAGSNGSTRNRGAAGGATGSTREQGATGGASGATTRQGGGGTGSGQSGSSGTQMSGQASASSSQSGSSGTNGASGANQS